jgi:hypothetical protein
MTSIKVLNVILIVAVLLLALFAALPGPMFSRYHRAAGPTTPGGFDPVPVFNQIRAELSFRGAHCGAQQDRSPQLHRPCVL